MMVKIDSQFWCNPSPPVAILIFSPDRKVHLNLSLWRKTLWSYLLISNHTKETYYMQLPLYRLASNLFSRYNMKLSSQLWTKDCVEKLGMRCSTLSGLIWYQRKFSLEISRKIFVHCLEDEAHVDWLVSAWIEMMNRLSVFYSLVNTYRMNFRIFA